MKELKRRLQEIEDYKFEVCFYEDDFIIVRCTDFYFKMDVKLMETLIQLATDINYKYRIKVLYSTMKDYEHLNFEMV